MKTITGLILVLKGLETEIQDHQTLVKEAIGCTCSNPTWKCDAVLQTKDGDQVVSCGHNSPDDKTECAACGTPNPKGYLNDAIKRTWKDKCTCSATGALKSDHPLERLRKDNIALLQKDDDTDEHSLTELIAALEEDAEKALHDAGHHEPVTYSFGKLTDGFFKQMRTQDDKDTDAKLKRTASAGARARKAEGKQ